MQEKDQRKQFEERVIQRVRYYLGKMNPYDKIYIFMKQNGKGISVRMTSEDQEEINL